MGQQANVSLDEASIELIRDIFHDSADVDAARTTINQHADLNSKLSYFRFLTGTPSKNGKCQITLRSRHGLPDQKFYVHLKHIPREYVSRLR